MPPRFPAPQREEESILPPATKGAALQAEAESASHPQGGAALQSDEPLQVVKTANRKPSCGQVKTELIDLMAS